METNSAASLMGSPECFERHFGGSTGFCQSALEEMHGSLR